MIPDERIAKNLKSADFLQDGKNLASCSAQIYLALSDLSVNISGIRKRYKLQYVLDNRAVLDLRSQTIRAKA